MINAKFATYDYYTIGDLNEYGQAKISEDVKGSVKMAIFPTSQSVQDNILYLNAQYMGLTHDQNINDTYVIQYGNIKLKVLYVSPTARLQQVFLSKVG